MLASLLKGISELPQTIRLSRRSLVQTEDHASLLVTSRVSTFNTYDQARPRSRVPNVLYVDMQCSHDVLLFPRVSVLDATRVILAREY